ncbi:MAG TPA: hypothetical protein VFX22_07560 [Candidatus Kapabacteria bacterium]|nr:hypothetical protein [Candidatus Kapabacteria bacterium]
MNIAARNLRRGEIVPVDVELRTYPNGLRIVSERVTGATAS